MLRQSIIYLSLSILVVLLASYAQLVIVYIDMFYTFVNIKLAPIFSTSEIGVMIRKVISLVLIPAVIAAIPAVIYRVIRGKSMPYFIELTWILWLVIVLSKVLIR